MDERIAFALKQAETGTPVAEFIRRMGISEQTFYSWKKVYGGLGVGELIRQVGPLSSLDEKPRDGHPVALTKSGPTLVDPDPR